MSERVDQDVNSGNATSYSFVQQEHPTCINDVYISPNYAGQPENAIVVHEGQPLTMCLLGISLLSEMDFVIVFNFFCNLFRFAFAGTNFASGAGGKEPNKKPVIDSSSDDEDPKFITKDRIRDIIQNSGWSSRRKDLAHDWMSAASERETTDAAILAHLNTIVEETGEKGRSTAVGPSGSAREMAWHFNKLLETESEQNTYRILSVLSSAQSMLLADDNRNITLKAHPHAPVSHATMMQQFPPNLYKACSEHTKAYKCFAKNLQTDHRKQAFSVWRVVEKWSNIHFYYDDLQPNGNSNTGQGQPRPYHLLVAIKCKLLWTIDLICLLIEEQKVNLWERNTEGMTSFMLPYTTTTSPLQAVWKYAVDHFGPEGYQEMTDMLLHHNPTPGADNNWASEYVSRNPADFKDYLDEISAETKYLSTISRLVKKESGPDTRNRIRRRILQAAENSGDVTDCFYNYYSSQSIVDCLKLRIQNTKIRGKKCELNEESDNLKGLFENELASYNNKKQCMKMNNKRYY
ncbi:hypothetical protein PROFUN_09524 [Planoprotostelium fungivorum]|uniref:Uncharacterized protein n=1 Tax=Planoprotostelium fungivorum TaxID=1890364 RepID=A0A2P6MSZ9_9EUKA|nr:hypothetical protein PROFUN_09524 [Planoprotostelium fungivorum]